MIRTAAFTLLEVILALAIVSLVLAAIAPALVGTMRAQRQAAAILEPLAEEQLALGMLRDDLLSAPLPTGSVAQAFAVESQSTNGHRGDTLTFFTEAAATVHPRLAQRAPELGQVVVTWSLQAAEDGHGLAWMRTRRANLLATGTAPEPQPEVLLDHVAELTVETLSGTTWSPTYNSDTNAGALPLAVRITYMLLDAADKPGARRQVVIDLPMVALAPTQAGGT
ncbi:MAG TPA: type II secretion system protein GspJ [Planctomycetota bacterium]|nr:type II secretion system protein GspJ [Planctomycetota bacterium]